MCNLSNILYFVEYKMFSNCSLVYIPEKKTTHIFIFNTNMNIYIFQNKILQKKTDMHYLSGILDIFMRICNSVHLPEYHIINTVFIIIFIEKSDKYSVYASWNGMCNRVDVCFQYIACAVYMHSKEVRSIMQCTIYYCIITVKP